MHRKVEIAQTSPGRDGWDDEREYDYTTSPNEHTVARRHPRSCATVNGLWCCS